MRDFCADSFTAPRHVVERALVADVADEVGEAVGAGDEVWIAIRPLPSMLVKASLKLALASNRGAATSKRLSRAGEAVERDRPVDLRPARDDRDRDDKREYWSRAQRPGDQLRADDRGAAREAAAQLAVPFEREADRAERRRQRDAAVGDVETKFGQRERLVARRRQQLVDLAPADPAVDQPAAQPHAARDDPINLEIAVPLQPRLDDREAGDEVGALGVADDEVADLLGPQADPVEVIARGDAAPFELALQIMRGDRPPLDPDDARSR